MPKLTVLVDEEFMERLKLQALKERRPASEIVRQLLNAYLLPSDEIELVARPGLADSSPSKPGLAESSEAGPSSASKPTLSEVLSRRFDG